MFVMNVVCLWCIIGMDLAVFFEGVIEYYTLLCSLNSTGGLSYGKRFIVCTYIVGDFAVATKFSMGLSCGKRFNSMYIPCQKSLLCPLSSEGFWLVE